MIESIDFKKTNNTGTNASSGSVTAFVSSSGVLSIADSDGVVETIPTASATATLTNKTFVAPVLGVASATSLATSAASPLLLTNGQLVSVALTSQTSGATTLTIPDFAGVVDEFTFKTKAQTLSNKTFVAPVLGAATGTSFQGIIGNVTPAAGTFTTVAHTGKTTITDTAGVVSSEATTNERIVPFFGAGAQAVVAAAAAIPLTNYHTILDSNAGVTTQTLAASTIYGQVKKITMAVDGGDDVVTVTSMTGGTTLTFSNVGDTVELMWNGSAWIVIARYNCATGAITTPVLA